MGLMDRPEDLDLGFEDRDGYLITCLACGDDKSAQRSGRYAPTEGADIRKQSHC
jgi:hypothetical protein